MCNLTQYKLFIGDDNRIVFVALTALYFLAISLNVKREEKILSQKFTESQHKAVDVKG